MVQWSSIPVSKTGDEGSNPSKPEPKAQSPTDSGRNSVVKDSSSFEPQDGVLVKSSNG